MCLGDAHRILTLARPQLWFFLPLLFLSSVTLSLFFSTISPAALAEPFLHHQQQPFSGSVFRAASSLRLELTGSLHLANSASLFICPAGHLTFTALARCQSPRSSPVHAERIPICPVVDTLIKVILTLTCKLSILHVNMSSSLIMSRSLEKPDTIKLSFSPYQFSFSSFDFITHHYIFIKHSHIGYHFFV